MDYHHIWSYGYTLYYANGQVQNNTITNIKSSFEIKLEQEVPKSGGNHRGICRRLSCTIPHDNGYAGKYNPADMVLSERLLIQ